jgi:hypothetical protein
MSNGLQQARVEAAAKAMYELRAKIDEPFWEGGKLDYGIKQIYRQDARAALAASDAHLPTVEQIAEVLSAQTTCDGEPWPTELHLRQAREVRALFREEVAGDETLA